MQNRRHTLAGGQQATQVRILCMFAACLFASGSGACTRTGPRPSPTAAHHPSLGHTFRGQTAQSDYADVLTIWTRAAKIYRSLDNKLFINATYHAPALRHAFAVAFPDIYGHGGKITRRELVDLTGGIEQHHNFFIGAYTPDARWNDFARDDSIWRLSLYGRRANESAIGEFEVGPDDIIPIKIDENLRAVYPYLSRFDKAYLVRFPLVDNLHRMIVDNDTQEVVMRIASALGVASMRWRVDGVQDPMHRLPTQTSPPMSLDAIAPDAKAQTPAQDD